MYDADHFAAYWDNTCDRELGALVRPDGLLLV